MVTTLIIFAMLTTVVIVRSLSELHIYMNPSKTKLVVFWGYIGIEWASCLKYLNTLFGQQSVTNVDIKARIEEARIALNNMKSFLENQRFGIGLRVRNAAMSFLSRLYVCGSWTKKNDLKRAKSRNRIS